MFYSKSTYGFYDSGLHGPLTVIVVDPAWIRPTTTITLQPGESVTIDGETYENTTDAPADYEVPDVAAVPDTIEQPNPATLIPADAVEITEEEWRALLEGQSAGKVITSGDDGVPYLADPIPPDPADVLLQTRLANARRYLAETDWLGDLVDMGQEQHLPHDVQTARAAALAFIDANT